METKHFCAFPRSCFETRQCFHLRKQANRQKSASSPLTPSRRKQGYLAHRQNNFKSIMSVVTFEKPSERVTLPVWYKRTNEMCRVTEKQIDDSFNVRNSSTDLRNETKLRTRWDTYISNIHLQNRYAEVVQWCDALEKSYTELEKEIALLNEQKALKELEIEQLSLHLNIIGDCIRQRDSRLGSELVFMDPADAAIKHELATVERLKRMLIEKCHSAWEQLNKLKEIQFKLQLDIGNKKDTMEIDRYNLEMTKDSQGISFKPDPLRVPNNCIPYETWIEVSTANKKNAEDEILKSRKLREDIFCTKEQSDLENAAAQERTDAALRCRLYDVQREKNELQWQRRKMAEEMEKMIKEIQMLTAALLEKTNAAKLAETRLENRMYRPGPELVQDYAQNNLGDEVRHLHKTRDDLQNRIDVAKAKYNELEDHLINLEHNISNKQHAMMIDARCLEMRNSLKMTEKESFDQMTLTRMEDEIPIINY